MTLINLRTLLDALPAPLPFGATLSVQRWANSAPATLIDGDTVTFPAKLAMRLDVDADPIDVPATDGRYCIRWVISVPPAYNVPPVVRHTSIPDVGPVEFADLTDVDPATFAPTRAVVGAWHDAIAVVRQLLDQAEDATAAAHEHEEAADRHADAARGYAGDAGARASDADASANAAAGYATAADRSAGEASDSRDDADRAATTADQSRALAEEAAALALAGQFAGAVIPAGADLNTYTTPGVWQKTGTAGSTVALNYPYEGFVGVILIVRRGADRPAQIAIPQGGGSNDSAAFYIRHLASSGWRPWRTYTSQRVDSTAGRAIYTWDNVNARDQLIYGDTGGRNINDLVAEGAATTTRVRRVGSVVQLDVLAWTPAVAGNRTVLTLPAGLRPPANVRAVAWREGSTRAALYALVYSDGRLVMSDVTLSAPISLSVTFLTENTWPTTLPGVASGGIPNA